MKPYIRFPHREICEFTNNSYQMFWHVMDEDEDSHIIAESGDDLMQVSSEGYVTLSGKELGFFVTDAAGHWKFVPFNGEVSLQYVSKDLLYCERKLFIFLYETGVKL